MIGNDAFKDCYNLVINVEAGSYGEVWARTCGYSYKINGVEEDTSWLNLYFITFFSTFENDLIKQMHIVYLNI